MRMKCHYISLGDTSNKFNGLIRVFLLHSFEIIYESFCAIDNIGIVLNVLVTNVLFDSASRVSFISHFVEGYGIFLVIF